jgi:hypothetical protein
MAPLPITKQVALLRAAWRPRCPASAEGWIFPRVGHHGNSGCMDVRHFCRTIIKPIVKSAWKGLYSGRRGGITAIIDLNNGDVVMGQMQGRHKNATTTLAFYKKRPLAALKDGMKALEAAPQFS